MFYSVGFDPDLKGVIEHVIETKKKMAKSEEMLPKQFLAVVSDKILERIQKNPNEVNIYSIFLFTVTTLQCAPP